MTIQGSRKLDRQSKRNGPGRRVKNWAATIILSVVAGVAAPARAAAVSSPTIVSGPVLAASPGRDLSFTVGDRVRMAHVTREGLSTQGISLREFPGHLQGTVGVESVDFRLEPNRVEGQIGNQPIGLDVWRSPDGLQVAGTFGQRPVAMEMRLTGIHAQVGPCWYSLPFLMGSYRGTVTCGAQVEPVTLSVPVSLAARDDLEIAAMLTALFGR